MTSRIPANISEFTFDVIIIGAGINGAGIARDAAMRGLQALVLDKGDLGGGTTSWSTRLIHGGLRYLEYGELGLVRESLRERESLLRIARHLVKPLPLLIPIYRSAKRGPLMIRAGMIGYDLLSINKSLPRHRMLSRSDALELEPGLNPAGLRGAAIYHDAQVEFAERLVVENVLSAKQNGAQVVTYAKVQKFITEGGAIRGVQGSDLLSGETFTARAPIVVNAAGPWVDQLLTEAELSQRLIGGTKGSHLVVAPFAFAPSTALYVEAESDNRPFFIIPWNGKFLIGTTDIRFEGDLDDVEIEADEIDYLLRETNRVVPAASLTHESILYTYSGVRPLPYAQTKDEQSITRRHFIRTHPDLEGLFSIVGGKLTTYRNLAEQAVDLIFRQLVKEVPECTTASTPLPGAGPANLQTLSDQLKTDHALSPQTTEHLLRVYGTRAREVVKLAAQDNALAENFDEETGAIAAEVIFSFQQEMAETLADCLLRRTMVGLNSSIGIGADEAAAAIAREYLDWSESRVQEEVAAYRAYVKRFQLHSRRNGKQ